MGDAGGRPDRVLETGGVAHRRRVEHGDVGEGAGGQRAAVDQVELQGRQAGHAAHRLFQAEQAQVPRVMAKDPREGAPKTRMGMGIEGQAVGADHRLRVA